MNDFRNNMLIEIKNESEGLNEDKAKKSNALIQFKKWSSSKILLQISFLFKSISKGILYYRKLNI